MEGDSQGMFSDWSHKSHHTQMCSGNVLQLKQTSPEPYKYIEKCNQSKLGIKQDFYSLFQTNVRINFV